MHIHIAVAKLHIDIAVAIHLDIDSYDYLNRTARGMRRGWSPGVPGEPSGVRDRTVYNRNCVRTL